MSPPNQPLDMNHALNCEGSIFLLVARLGFEPTRRFLRHGLQGSLDRAKLGCFWRTDGSGGWRPSFLLWNQHVTHGCQGGRTDLFLFIKGPQHPSDGFDQRGRSRHRGGFAFNGFLHDRGCCLGDFCRIKPAVFGFEKAFFYRFGKFTHIGLNFFNRIGGVDLLFNDLQGRLLFEFFQRHFFLRDQGGG